MIHDFFYNHSNREPIIFTSRAYRQPILCSKDRIHKMIPINEFYERLLMRHTRPSQVRYCNNEMENEKSEMLQGLITNDFNENETIDPTYWEERYQLMHKQMARLRKKASSEEVDENAVDLDRYRSNKISNYVYKIMKMLKGNVHAPFSIEKYGHMIDNHYSDENRRNIISDTYMCSMLLPDNEVIDPNNLFGFVVKHPELSGVDYMLNMKIPRDKHSSLNTLQIYQKNIKKIQQVRHFFKPHSVFARWMSDTK